jgi:hypothetical protein
MKVEIDITAEKITARCEGAWLWGYREREYFWTFRYYPEDLATQQGNLLMGLFPRLVEAAELAIAQGINSGRIDAAKVPVGVKHRVFVACDHAVARQKIDSDLLAQALARGIEPVTQKEDCFIPIGLGLAHVQPVFPQTYPDFVAPVSTVFQSDPDSLPITNGGRELRSGITEQGTECGMHADSRKGIKAALTRAKVWARSAALYLRQLVLGGQATDVLNHPEHNGDQDTKQRHESLHGVDSAATVSTAQTGKAGK